MLQCYNACCAALLVRYKRLIYADCPLMVILVTDHFPHYDLNDDDAFYDVQDYSGANDDADDSI